MKHLLLVTLTLLLALPSWAADIQGTKINGYDFGYAAIEKGCSVERQGRSISVVCKDKKLKPVSRSCEGQMMGGLDSVKLNCSGGLWALNQRCKIIMLGATEGEINCKL